ncbi:MAG: caspase family protein [Nonlabens sp.]|uniref:caspase family protein n=1 Tax=Nonlabens sp. TaxID=1888209 RepID=UPI003EF8DBB0
MKKSLKTLSATILFFIAFISLGQELKLGLPIGHTSDVNSSQYSSNGDYILTYSEDYTLKLWEAKSGKLIHDFKGHSDQVTCAQFSPDNKKIVSASYDKKVRVWDVKTGKLIHILDGHNELINFAEFSPDNQFIVTTSSFDHTARVWNSKTGLLHQIIEFENSDSFASSARFSPNSKLLVTASCDKTVKIWDLQTNRVKLILEKPDDQKIIGCLAQFSLDGKLIITTYSNILRIWDAESGKLKSESKAHSERIIDSEMSPNGKFIVTVSTDQTAVLWSTDTGKVIHKFEGFTGLKNPVKFSSDSKYIIIPVNNGATIWNVSTGKSKLILKNHIDDVYSADFSPSNDFVITSSADQTCKISDASNGKIIKTLSGNTGLISGKFSPDGNSIVFKTWDDALTIIDLKSGKKIQKLWSAISDKYQKWSYNISDFEYSPNGRKLVSIIEEKKIKLWDVDTGKILLTYEPKTDNGNSIRLFTRFSQDGEILIVGDFNESVTFFNTTTGKQIQKIDIRQDIAELSSSNKFAITMKFNYEKTIDSWDILLWNIDTKELIKVIHTGSNKPMNTVKFSPDKKFLIASSDDDVAKLWNIESGELIYTLQGHTDEIYKIHFISNGEKYITTSLDGYTKIWSKGKNLQTFKGNFKVDSQIETNITSDEKFMVTVDKFDVLIWELDSGKLISKIDGLSTLVNSTNISPNNKYLNINYDNGLTKLYDLTQKEILISQIIFDSDPNKWVHLHPSGLFDASPEAMELMYWTKGLEVIEFSQLKEKYYMPGLWEKVLKDEYLGNVDIKKDGIKLQPVVSIGEIENNILPIHLTKREGGYGELSVFLNGKEIIKDARPNGFDESLKHQTINIDISNFNSLTQDGENEFTVKVKNRIGDVQSRGAVAKNIVKKESKPPNFYGLFIGVNDYVGDIDLSFPVPDTDAMYNALELGAQNLFGKDKTHLYKLTTGNNDNRPRKNKIIERLTAIAAKANPEDVLFIYLSGHGLTWTNNKGESDFYYLTEDARFANKEAYNDKDTREQTAISTNELVDYIKNIAASKTVMVIDACGSGQAVDNLIASRDVESDQIKAIDRMKDRTGMFIISGSAADEVSYEASKYGQGLLTYSLLKAMSGVALKGNRSIDIGTLFNYAKDQVPVLAEDIGGIQEPQVLFPKSGSFDIGILNLDDQQKIEIKEPKDVFVRSTLINLEELEDNLNLSDLLDSSLNSINSRGKDIIWVDAKNYANGCKISGSYNIINDIITLNFKIKCKDKETKFKVTGKNKDEIINLVLDKI